MLHVSTRGEAPTIGFTDALLTGLARDGGLYVPEAWPTLTRDAIQGFAGRRRYGGLGRGDRRTEKQGKR